MPLPILYIACPYTDPDPKVREHRVALATKVAAIYIKKGHVVYSPLTHSHPIDVELGETLSSDFWVTFDETFMEICDEMLIIQSKGWAESKGIERERQFFKARNRPISFFLPGYLDV